MTTELLDEIHPGEILREDFIKPLGITARPAILILITAGAMRRT